MPRDEPISMYVPARNAARTLGACVEAIRAQTRPPDELFIVVDPRSTDGTLDAARSLGQRIVLQEGLTLGSARNQAIDAAANRWLACCDSDVVIDPDWLERLAARRSDHRLKTGATLSESDAPWAAGIGGATHERVQSVIDAWRALHMPHHWGAYGFRNPFMLVSEVLFDRDALLSVGGYREDLNYYEDSDLCQRLRDAGYDLIYEPGARATHLREDDLHGLLDLRWKYSEYRQRHLLDRYAGLRSKIAVNREYALGTLSRSLARGHDEQVYISFLLFFHHLILDLRSLLSRRPMIDAASRHGFERQLFDAVRRVVSHRHATLGAYVSDDLRPMLESGAGKPGAPEPPLWGDHLDAVETAAAALCSEFSPELLEVIASSAAFVHGRIRVEDVYRFRPPRWEIVEQGLAESPIESGLDHELLTRVRRQWPEADGFTIVGRMTERERDALGGMSARLSRGRDAVGIAAHLECEAEPLAVLRKLPLSTERLVACYRSPARFIAGLDVPSASDLASAAAEAGWTIERFETIVGRVCLMLSRSARPDRDRDHDAARAETAATSG